MNPDDAENGSLVEAIGEAIGERFELIATETVSGGCIHTALKVAGNTSGGRKNFFAKINAAEKKTLFETEADGLTAIQAVGAVTSPRVIVQGDDGERAWLVLEWLDLAPLDAASGWGRDNFIGSTPQVNGWSEDWLSFWRGKRLLAQLRLAAHNRLPSRMIDRGERLVADCEAFFGNYAPAKSLLHGDLWGGNAAAIAGGKPIVFDPAVYVGDREADLAMTELFGGFPKEFMAAYRAAWALDHGYSTRRNLYNLYQVLNHANLFAGSYVRQAEQSIERLLAEIR